MIELLLLTLAHCALGIELRTSMRSLVQGKFRHPAPYIEAEVAMQRKHY